MYFRSSGLKPFIVEAGELFSSGSKSFIVEAGELISWGSKPFIVEAGELSWYNIKSALWEFWVNVSELVESFGLVDSVL